MLIVSLALACLPPQEGRDPVQLLTALTSHLAGLKSFKADVNATYALAGQKGTFKTSYSLAVRRPNNLALILTRAEADGKVAYDGKKIDPDARVFALDLLSDGTDVYYYFSPAQAPPVAKMKAPADLDGLRASAVRTEWELGLIKNEILALVHTKPADSFAGWPGGAWAYQGLEEVDAVKCHRISHEVKLALPGRKELATRTRFWVEDGPKPKLLRYDLTDGDGTAPGYSMTISFSKWILEPALTDADFKVPPVIGR